MTPVYYDTRGKQDLSLFKEIKRSKGFAEIQGRRYADRLRIGEAGIPREFRSGERVLTTRIHFGEERDGVAIKQLKGPEGPKG